MKNSAVSPAILILEAIHFSFQAPEQKDIHCSNNLLFPLDSNFTKWNLMKEYTGVPKHILKGTPFFTHQIAKLNDSSDPTSLPYGLIEKASSFRQEISEMNRNEKP